MYTPLFTALMQHAKRKSLSFHVPGHKNGKVFINQAEEIYKNILSLDVTELTGLDDLHHPTDVIAESQELTAKLYGVKNSYFLVNGSTVGNMAMILASCNEGDEVLVQRNSHKSIINAIQLAGATPIFLSPKIDTVLQVPSYVEMQTIKHAIDRYPNAKALILTNPNYYGLTVDLKEAVELAHSCGIPVLVDEAHGAHFKAGIEFPASAVDTGADMIVHSAHKTLPAMTMGSFLHYNSNLIDREKVEFYLAVLQSSSPSYPIMASLDLARAYLEELIDNQGIDSILKAIINIKEQLTNIDGLEILESADPFVHIDPLKITVRSTSGLSGYELQDWFELHNVFIELADPLNALMILPLDHKVVNLEHLSKKTSTTSISITANKRVQLHYKQNKGINRLEQPYSVLKICEKELIKLEDAIGAISAESIIPYPPGIPLIIVGETITKDLIEQLKEMLEMGINIQGDNNIRQGNIKIYKNRG
ncbi:arginine/lysine/ornithine decarboxylase [Metabacillus crassostreae]|uniref:aminotransferase class I/II-fold pyridoxal phosphate-dependent enzyme n=1 Tax=Metabacillus crassostreae TaxID=929098 RepID=UPI0019562068|nr:aminotransferase class I/II-fold pyridoxal phosphate-dependent enzyme [Metabacillus crassostreae]MBM7606593.1 arginine/lysine/ornithine decarboxylase [Metabacillus crassostreae]